MNSLSKPDLLKDRKKCLICHRAVDIQFRPFCSKRCQHIDLGKWFSGVYSIPSDEIEPVSEEEEN